MVSDRLWYICMVDKIILDSISDNMPTRYGCVTSDVSYAAGGCRCVVKRYIPAGKLTRTLKWDRGKTAVTLDRVIRYRIDPRGWVDRDTYILSRAVITT